MPDPKTTQSVINFAVTDDVAAQMDAMVQRVRGRPGRQGKFGRSTLAMLALQAFLDGAGQSPMLKRMKALPPGTTRVWMSLVEIMQVFDMANELSAYQRARQRGYEKRGEKKPGYVREVNVRYAVPREEIDARIIEISTLRAKLMGQSYADKNAGLPPERQRHSMAAILKTVVAKPAAQAAQSACQAAQSA